MHNLSLHCAFTFSCCVGRSRCLKASPVSMLIVMCLSPHQYMDSLPGLKKTLGFDPAWDGDRWGRSAGATAGISNALSTPTVVLVY